MTKDLETERLDEEFVAADWLLRVEEGLSADEQSAFEAWIEEKPARAEILARQAAVLNAPVEAREQTPAIRLPDPPQRAPTTPPRAGWRRFATAALMGLAAVSALSVAYVADQSRRSDASQAVASLATQRGEVAERTLSDSSHVWIDARTEAAFEAETAQRRLNLAHGRVFVEVEKDPERPFVVAGTSLSATAVGTAFEVAAFEAYELVQVAEGRVRVAAGGQEYMLEPGDTLRFDLASGALSRGQVSPGAIALWRDYMVRFQDTALSDALSEVNRYRQKPIIVEDADLAGQRISGLFPVGALDEDATPQLIAEALGASAQDTPDGQAVVLAP